MEFYRTGAHHHFPRLPYDARILMPAAPLLDAGRNALSGHDLRMSERCLDSDNST